MVFSTFSIHKYLHIGTSPTKENITATIVILKQLMNSLNNTFHLVYWSLYYKIIYVMPQKLAHTITWCVDHESSVEVVSVAKYRQNYSFSPREYDTNYFNLHADWKWLKSCIQCDATRFVFGTNTIVHTHWSGDHLNLSSFLCSKC